MDFLKVLSRGTSLSKGASKNAPAQQLPSSGGPSNPQLFGHDATQAKTPEDASSNPSKNKKRKRGQQQAAPQSADLPPELDFFGDGARDKHEGVSLATDATKKTLAEESAKEVAQDADGAAQPLDEEECKRILRTHKIKITLLEDRKAKEEERKSKKRKKSKAKEAPQKKTKVQLFPQPLTSFKKLRGQFGVSKKLSDNINAQGYSVPTEVQLASLPLLLDDAGPEGTGIDLLTVAPTGSGKTLAFLIPVVNALLKKRKDGAAEKGVQTIILAPTKELASQIVNEGRKLALKTGIKVSLMKKGMEVLDQAAEDDAEEEQADESSESENDGESDSGSDTKKPSKKRKRGQLVKSEILVTTPLTLVHALQGSNGKVGALPTVKYLILDEADVLLDPLFREQTLDIWNACGNPQLRVSLWSATMGSNIEELATSTIDKRWEALEDSTGVTRPDLVRLVVGLKDSAVPNVHHQLTYAATEQGKLLAVRQLLHPTAPTSRDNTPTLRPPFLIFTQTIPRAQALFSELQYDIPPEAGGSTRIAVLHSSLSSSLRDNVMARFRKGEVWVLITTDLLSRGVDFRGINGVVNYDAPTSGAAYIHRVGRTGRAGRAGGVAVTLYTEEDVPYIKNIANIIRASEQLSGKPESEATVQQWLLDALPTPSKRDKQRLKKRGVEARRAGVVGNEEGRGKLKTRISTKSGFERRVENNRKGAVEGSRRRKETGGAEKRVQRKEEASDGEFGGFED
ncbi:uncharacterized protein K452DRAFT_289460 [Aplosporella prunicola CBS 121167]|uniref:ATP-dependent RNA helicase ROK1 n=1 Tax=Aplosporella prunicola CBS 121167 TaxID=1176127 RepID=A0A6A6B7M8_9PEZI|nr:uncharacterized protein K452DRAFT_289460 [Aplosporella prunicola CBS 121167]KAF2140070.1 hypothetical protein K452DRAFT_289460 [Aplosporella prunicola CBS 121167]